MTEASSVRPATSPTLARLLRAAGRLRTRLTLPLFARELTEAAARRRTYVMRFLYAAVLFAAAAVFSRDILFPADGRSLSVLGRGGELFRSVLNLQYAGVCLFLPALTAGAITAEKERNTLGLLLLTKLSPTAIVLEKYLARVFPMLCLALSSLPLLAVAYSLGGLDRDTLVRGTLGLGATILQVGAIGIACSAWCRSTAAAFLATYVVALAVMGTLPFLREVRLIRPTEGLYGTIAEQGEWLGLWRERSDARTMFAAPLQSQNGSRRLTRFGISPLSVPGSIAPPSPLLPCLPILATAAMALLAARVFLVRRAEARPRHLVVRAFRRIDRTFCDLNERYAKGYEVVRTRGALPESDPVAWRETTKTPLGSFRYLVRLLVAVETPTLCAATLLAATSDGRTNAVVMLLVLLWPLAALAVVIKGTGLFAAERARQTLDVLLATPLPTRDIVRQKLAGVRRLIAVVAVPLLSVHLVSAIMFQTSGTKSVGEAAVRLLAAASATAVYLLLAAYVALLPGLRSASRGGAVLSAVAALAVLCFAGWLAIGLWSELVSRVPRIDEVPWLLLCSPLFVLAAIEGAFSEIGPATLFFLSVGNVVLYGCLALILRAVCYRNAARWLGRDEDP